MPPEKPPNENVPHATHPADERPRSLSLINPNDATHWLALADTALHQGASEENIAETEALARKEQTAIKRRIRRTSERVKRHSKSKQ